MTLPVRKGYSGAGVSTTLTSNPTNTDTTFTVASTTNWPTTYPFFVVVDPGTTKEEKMLVTGVSFPTVTVSRGSGNGDGTNAVAHSSGAVCYPVFTATEAEEANLIASVMTTKGDLISTNGSDINRLPVGTNTHVLQADSTATNGVKWGQVVTAGLTDLSITTGKLADLSITTAKIADTNVTTAKIADTNVTTDKIADLNVTTGKLADAAVTSPKLAAPTLTAKTDSFTLALVDANCTMQCNKATAMTLTVPDSSVAFANGTVITVVNYGAGQVTVAPASGVNIRSSNGLKLRTQYSMASLVKISNTEWVLSGDTVTA
jgi:hypothetical protein